jgi:hypothetical protein
MKSCWRVGGLLVAVLLVLGAAVGCGGGGDGGLVVDDNPAPEPGDPSLILSGDRTSGISLEGFAAVGNIGLAGGTVALAGGPSLVVKPNTSPWDAEVGITNAEAPAVDLGTAQTLGSWYRLASTNNDVRSYAALNTLTLSLPATVPAEALGHPGLQLMAVLGDLALPVDGTYDQGTGLFSVELVGIPPDFTFALTFDPFVEELSTEDLGGLPSAPNPAGPWGDSLWTMRFNGQQIKAAQVKTVLGYAKKAADTYAAAGFLAPNLYAKIEGPKVKWMLQLTAGGSEYNPNVDAGAADLAMRFGRIYLGRANVDSTPEDKAGGCLSIVAHEMFHAIFNAYNIPAICFDVWEGTEKFCYNSHSGFNEGMATAAGYFLEHGSPAQVRPNEPRNWLSMGLGTCEPAKGMLAYMNQDFFVRLLRIGTLEDFPRVLVALQKTVMPTTVTQLRDVVGRYSEALQNNFVVDGNSFTGMYLAYLADRGFERTPDGWIRDDEPLEAEGGTQWFLAEELFTKGSRVEITADFCDVVGETLVCALEYKKVMALAGILIELPLGVDGPLPNKLLGKALQVKISGLASAGAAAFAAFGMNDFQGSAQSFKRSFDGAEVTMTGLEEFESLGIIAVVGGASEPTLTIKVVVSGEEQDEGGWVDPSTGLRWQNPAAGFMDFEEASAYCPNLGAGWRLPTVSEARSLFRGCDAVGDGGACGISDGCTNHDCGDGTPCEYNCSYDNGPGLEGCYWDGALQGQCTAYWTGTTVADWGDSAFYTQFASGTVGTASYFIDNAVRCVKK